MEQQLILVDEKDKFFGKYASKGKCHFGQGLHHLAFTLMILNDKGEVLLQERKHELWDHFWDLTNSHPLHLENGQDETIKEAVSRCLKGEWGVDFPVETLFTFNYFAQYKNDFCENEYCYFLLGKYSGEVFPAEEVAYGYKWKLLGKLETDIKTHPEIYTPWLIRSMEELKKRTRENSCFLKMTARIKVSAPGKIILSGEHAVVYGFPAILAAVNRRLSIEIGKNDNHVVFPSEGEDLVKFSLAKIKEIAKIEFSNTLRATISSEIPIGCGMGSSAAFAVALTAAVLRYCEVPWDLEEINKIAYEIEKKQHGNPSGGDNTVSTYGGFLLYRKETETCKVFSPLKITIFPSFFLINTGKPVETTGEMVSKVKEFRLRFPAKGERIFRDIEQTTRGFLKFLSGEKSSLEELIRTNERLLEELGVVSRNTRNLIRKVEKIGGSAKISGAGGLRENSGVILAYHQDPEVLLKFAGEENLDIFEVKLGERGVRSEKNF